MHKNFKIGQSGFSLIELMGSLVIIGILSGILIIYNQSAVTKAVDTKVKTFANSVPITLSGSYVAAWKLDQINVPTTNQTPDAWGANDCTLMNDGEAGLPTLQTTNCPFGNCLHFTSSASTTGNYLDCGNSIDFNLTKSYTMEAWINLETLGAAGTASRIISKSVATAGASYDYWFQVNNNAHLLQTGLIESGGSARNLSGLTPLVAGTWYHIVASKDSSSFYLYINGVLDNSGVSGGLSMADARVNAASHLYIGRLGASSAWNYSFNGTMDDVRIYNDALKLGQIQQNYLAGLKNLLAAGQISQSEYANRLDSLNQCVASAK